MDQKLFPVGVGLGRVGLDQTGNISSPNDNPKPAYLLNLYLVGLNTCRIVSLSQLIEELGVF